MLEKLNYKQNKVIDLGNGSLNGQGSGPLSRCRYGFFNMGYNGCEIIAVYNLCYLMGAQRPLCEIAKEIYPYGNWLWGIFGTRPMALQRYFDDNGLPVRRDKDFGDFRLNFAKKRFGIMSFWNTNTIFGGIHTVAIENTPEGFKVYNRSNKSVDPVIYKSIDDYMDYRRFICGYYAEQAMEKSVEK